MFYKRILRPLLFQLDSEQAHDLALSSAHIGWKCGGHRILELFGAEPSKELETEEFGLTFKSPIGLAAGFDKNAVAAPLLGACGFRHVEIGTVTACPQEGNPKPRIFRFPEQEAVINRMGFPSLGCEAIASRLPALRRSLGSTVLGINIGKSKTAPIDSAEKDYCRSFAALEPFADYFTINVSSPNTPDLRKLQEPGRLKALFLALKELNKRALPILVKIAPDLTKKEIEELLVVCDEVGISGIIATNTTFERPGFSSGTDLPSGGLSGKPLYPRSLEIVRFVSECTSGRLPIIAVGGIRTGEDAFFMLQAGARLVQVYSALIFEGPLLGLRLERELLESLRARGFSSVRELKESIRS